MKPLFINSLKFLYLLSILLTHEYEVSRQQAAPLYLFRWQN